MEDFKCSLYNGMTIFYNTFAECDDSSTPMKFRPYRNVFIDLEHDPYENVSADKTDVDEIALDKFINRIVTNQAIALANYADEHVEDLATCVKYTEDTMPGVYKVPTNTIFDHSAQHKRRTSKNIRRGRRKKNEAIQDKYEYYNSDPYGGNNVPSMNDIPMITLSVDMLRKYMFAEVESKVRLIHQYYKTQYEQLNKDYLVTLGVLLQTHEDNRDLLEQYYKMEEQVQAYKQLYQKFGSKVAASKEERHRKRHARKQRKTQKPVASKSDTISQDTISQDTISQDTISQDTISQDTISQDTISQDTISQDTISQDTISSKNSTDDNCPGNEKTETTSEHPQQVDLSSVS